MELSSIRIKPKKIKIKNDFLSQHLRHYHFIFIYLHANSEMKGKVPMLLKDLIVDKTIKGKMLNEVLRMRPQLSLWHPFSVSTSLKNKSKF